MTRHFLVELIDTIEADPPSGRVTAPDADTAITAFLALYAPTDHPFLDYVYRPTSTLSFAEQFWIQTDADDDRLAQGQLQLSDDLLAERVQQFFDAHHDYADLYLRAYHTADSHDTPRPTFPPEMLAYMWRPKLFRYGSISMVLLSIQRKGHLCTDKVINTGGFWRPTCAHSGQKCCWPYFCLVASACYVDIFQRATDVDRRAPVF